MSNRVTPFAAFSKVFSKKLWPKIGKSRKMGEKTRESVGKVYNFRNLYIH